MKHFVQESRSNILHALATLLFSFIVISSMNASPGGIAGRTLKSNRSGCGTCHGSSAASAVTSIITGPDTVIVGKPSTYTLTISGGPAKGAGCNVAAKYGTLSAISSSLKLSNGELTQRSNASMSNGSIAFQFTYTAPASRTSDTLYATGLSTNSNGGTSGDSWNWSPNKAVTVLTPTSILDNSSVSVSEFQLENNFPNPFGYTTTFRFTLSSAQHVTLAVYDLKGRLIATVANETLSRGVHHMNFNAAHIPDGVYLYRLQAGARSETRKCVIDH